jgi:hypothetical protein
MRLQKINRESGLPAQMLGTALDVVKVLNYRPELFGRAFSSLTHVLLRGESDWAVGERELFAAYTSHLNKCPF